MLSVLKRNFMEALARQPKGFYILVMIEVWDRLTYYGIQSVLVIYLANRLLVSDVSAYAIYGIYSTLAFSMPILGGFLADKFLGYRYAIIVGMVLNFLAGIILVKENIPYLYFGLATVVSGIGLLKANSASLLGTLYAERDIRKESGFTLFYMGMNVGVILGPLIYGFLAVEWGWQYAFMVGSVGAVISLIVFVPS